MPIRTQPVRAPLSTAQRRKTVERVKEKKIPQEWQIF